MRAKTVREESARRSCVGKLWLTCWGRCPFDCMGCSIDEHWWCGYSVGVMVENGRLFYVF